jgi:hypothetical protein
MTVTSIRRALITLALTAGAAPAQFQAIQPIDESLGPCGFTQSLAFADPSAGRLVIFLFDPYLDAVLASPDVTSRYVFLRVAAPGVPFQLADIEWPAGSGCDIRSWAAGPEVVLPLAAGGLLFDRVVSNVGVLDTAVLGSLAGLGVVYWNLSVLATVQVAPTLTQTYYGVTDTYSTLF